MNSNFKKYLPFIAVIVLAIVVVGGIFIAKRASAPMEDNNNQTDEASLAEIPQDQRPVAALIPKPDGHFLTLTISNIKVSGANSLDYELLWKANNAGTQTTQGTSGTVKLDSASFTKDLLLGSESSGKFRYDQGVETGTLTLRFRDSKGKLLGKLATDFHMQTGSSVLTAPDASFKYTLSKPATGVWFITIKPFGTPDASKVVVFQNDWAIYASDGLPHTGSAN